MNKSFAASVSVADEILETLQSLVDGFKKSGMPEPIGSTVTTIRADLQVLLEDFRTKQLHPDAIEDSLKEMAATLSLSLAISIDEDERQRMVEDIKRIYINRTLDNDSRAKLLNRQLRNKFNLPELTLYAF